MEVFFETFGADKIAELAGVAIAGAIEDVAAGRPPDRIVPTAEAESEIEAKFRSFLSEQKMDGIGIPGVPTQAALNGVSHRFLHPYAKRPERPSFIDTGLYQANFKAWFEA